MFNPRRHNRRSMRLQGYDYAGIGLYFVTVCAARRGPIFGPIRDGEMRVNAHGRIVLNEWRQTEILRPEVSFDSWCLMPDHLHALI